jgi:hypothetical protein
MMDVLQFVFSGFWRFCGSVVLLSLIVGGIAGFRPVYIVLLTAALLATRPFAEALWIMARTAAKEPG